MRKTTAIIAGAIAALITIQFSVQARAQQPQVTEPGTDIGTFYKDEEGPLYKAPGYSPYAGRNYPTRVLWGSWSTGTCVEESGANARLSRRQTFGNLHGEPRPIPDVSQKQLAQVCGRPRL